MFGRARRIGLLGLTLLLGTATHTAAETPTAALRLVPPGSLSGPLVLVWPEHLRRPYRDTTDLTAALIQALPADREIALLAPRPPSEAAQNALNRPVRYLPARRVEDTHLGAWHALPAIDATGRLHAVQFTLPPPDPTDRRAAGRRLNRAQTARELGQTLYGVVQPIDLTLAPPSLVQNGRGLALLSQRVIGDNEHRALTELSAELAARLGVEQVVWLPVPPDAPAGELTRWVRFLDDRHLLINVDTSSETRRAYGQRLRELLIATLPEDIQLIPVAAGPNGENYVDLLHTGSTLLLPQYGLPTDDAARRSLQRALPEADIQTLPPELGQQLHQQGVGLSDLIADY